MYPPRANVHRFAFEHWRCLLQNLYIWQLLAEMMTIHSVTKTHKVYSLKTNSIVYCLDIENAIFLLMHVCFCFGWTLPLNFSGVVPFRFYLLRSGLPASVCLCLEHFHQPTQSATILILKYATIKVAISLVLLLTWKNTVLIFSCVFVCECAFQAICPYRWYPWDVFNGTL